MKGKVESEKGNYRRVLAFTTAFLATGFGPALGPAFALFVFGAAFAFGVVLEMPLLDFTTDPGATLALTLATRIGAAAAAAAAAASSIFCIWGLKVRT